MFKNRFISYITAISLSLVTFGLSKEVAKEPVHEVIAQADILKKAAKVSNEDLSALKHPLKPMLWKVEGKGLTKASYLFGSIHVADKNITTLHPTAEAAYQQADTLATEVNMGFINQIRAAKLMIRKDDKTLKESVGDEIFGELDAQLMEIDPSLSADTFNNMKTWVSVLTISMIEEQMKMGETKPFDLQLWDRAGKDNKKQWVLETMAEQLGGLDRLTDKEQIILLSDTLKSLKLLKKEKINSITMMKNLYLKGDPDEFISLLQQLGNLEGFNLEVSKKFETLILSDRNKRMTANIQKTFADNPDQSHFIVAGALHYIGEQNIVDLLRQQGFTVTLQK